MTDKTDALIEQVEQMVGMGHEAWDTINPREIAAAFREALAAPAEGGQGEVVDLGEVIREKVREHGSYRAASKAIGVNYPYLCQMAHDPNRKPSKEILAALGLERVTVTRRLIDSAGGAKGEVTIDLDRVFLDACNDAVKASTWMPAEYMANDWQADVLDLLRNGPGTFTPQPAEDDGAVAAPYGYEHDGRFWFAAGATPWVIHHATPLYTRPAATAQVPDAGPWRWHPSEPYVLASDDFKHDAHIRFSGDFADHDDVMSYKDWLLAKLNAAPAAPKGGVVDEAARALVEKIEAIHADPVYQGVWICAHNHGVPYTGPKYDKELAALRAALATGEQP